jgi:3-deoxy-D-manno-octulosonate 8-phosphate phosphatase (KDO 8-P phosphatase)
LTENSKYNIQGVIQGDPETFVGKLSGIRALVFDWDGVFNDGTKGRYPSTYNEIDSMGINMLRFGYFLHHNLNPVTVIVTGEKNDNAIQWAKREHFHSVFLKAKNKIDILPVLRRDHGIFPEEILFIFDDIHDLSLGVACGVRILIPNPGGKMFAAYCRQNNHIDYYTANSGGNNALREISETVLHKLGLFEKTVEERIKFQGIYLEYWKIRNEVKTTVLELNYGEGQFSSPEIRKDESDTQH